MAPAGSLKVHPEVMVLRWACLHSEPLRGTKPWCWLTLIFESGEALLRTAHAAQLLTDVTSPGVNLLGQTERLTLRFLVFSTRNSDLEWIPQLPASLSLINMRTKG